MEEPIKRNETNKNASSSLTLLHQTSCSSTIDFVELQKS